MADLGGPQISALLENLPGIANVLRSPVANSLVAMIRAGARVGEFRMEDARELVQYAVRRGLIGSDEGERLMAEVKVAAGKRAEAPRPRVKSAKPKTPAARRAPRGVRRPPKAAARKAKPTKAPKKKRAR